MHGLGRFARLYPYLKLGPVVLGTYGICAALGFLAALGVFKADLIRRRFPGGIAGVIVVTTTLVGLIGAKLYYILETPAALHGGFFHALLQPAGLSWLGGLITGMAAVCILGWRYHIPPLTMLDMTAPIGAITYAFGRIGCLMAGDGDYGTPTSLPWGMTFPHGTVPTFEPVHPTPIYEAAFSFALCWFLWRLGARYQIPGLIAGAYLFLSGIARFAVEFIKLNPRLYFGLTNAQVVSIVSVIVGAALLLRAYRKAPNRALTAAPSSGHGTVCD
jgi:phosphatidylglycerol:prolipoprotein diacylglycerol transferase